MQPELQAQIQPQADPMSPPSTLAKAQAETHSEMHPQPPPQAEPQSHCEPPHQPHPKDNECITASSSTATDKGVGISPDASTDGGTALFLPLPECPMGWYREGRQPNAAPLQHYLPRSCDALEREAPSVPVSDAEMQAWLSTLQGVFLPQPNSEADPQLHPSTQPCVEAQLLPHGHGGPVPPLHLVLRLCAALDRHLRTRSCLAQTGFSVVDCMVFEAMQMSPQALSVQWHYQYALPRLSSWLQWVHRQLQQQCRTSFADLVSRDPCRAPTCCSRRCDDVCWCLQSEGFVLNPSPLVQTTTQRLDYVLSCMPD